MQFSSIDLQLMQHEASLKIIFACRQMMSDDPFWADADDLGEEAETLAAPSHNGRTRSDGSPSSHKQ